jgi:hypothetical protein
MAKLYYTPPTDKQFNELKEKAIEVWRENYDDAYGYVTGKVNQIKDIGNVQDNFMYMVAMFDINNQALLAVKLSPETRKAVRERMIDGGNPPEYIIF